MKTVLMLGFVIMAVIGKSNHGPININKHPYLLELLNNRKHWCTAVLISSRIVLSAAQCTYKVPKRNLTILAGTSISENIYTKQYKISSIYHYNKYKPEKPYNDISIIFPTLAIVADGKYVQPTQVTEIFYLPKTEVIVSGWKYVKDRYVLLSRKLELIAHRTCKKIYKKINITVFQRDLCAYEENDAACQAEPGGALIFKNKLVGIASRIYHPTCKQYPGLYTSFLHFKKFVKSTVINVLNSQRNTKNK